MAKKYIESDEAVSALEQEAKDGFERVGAGYAIICADCAKIVREIPAADVRPVVRCKDCVHYDKGENDSESWMYCKVLSKDVYDDFYCKLGKRREVQHDD